MADIGSINFGGLASGLDTKALIEAIMRAERRPLDRLELRRSQLSQRRGALDEMRTTLKDFLTTLKDLRTDRTFLGRTATSSDEELFTVAARPGAETGVFSVEIFDLAAAHKIKSNGLSASDEALVTDGTITIQSGANELITVDVSSASGNNTLEAVRDAINAADAGVGASVLFDGTDYRLIVRAEESGVENALTITDSTNLGLADPANEVLAAADASFKVDGIAITSSSNQVTGVIQGVTLDLLSPTTGTPVNFQVAEDIDTAVEGVQALVSAYNDVVEFFNGQLDSENPGPLGSDSTTRRLQLRLQSYLTSGAEGIPLGEIRSLASLGISFDGRSGKMSLDAAELRELLEERFDEVGRLFLESGSTSDARIRFAGSSSLTQAGDYTVEITQAAERASVVGSAAIDPAGLNRDETLTITANGVTTNVDLLAGQDITQVVDATNTALAAAGLSATAEDDGGALRISTSAYGADQDISVTSSENDTGNDRQTNFDDTPSTDVGADLAGRIDGVDATGSGQFLTAAAGGPAEGLQVRVTASAQDVIDTGGDFGTVSFSPGLTQGLTAYLDSVTRVGDGTIESAREILDGDLRRITDEVGRLEERLANREARLVRTFAEAEQALSLLQAQQAQLGSLTIF